MTLVHKRRALAGFTAASLAVAMSATAISAANAAPAGSTSLTIIETQVPTTAAGFGKAYAATECAYPAGVDPTTVDSWHFITAPQNFTALSAVYDTDGDAGSATTTRTLADAIQSPDASHAYITTPPGWVLLSASATVDATRSPAQFPLSHTCPAAELPAPDITVDKAASPTAVPETGGDVTFTFTVANAGTVAATISSLSDSVFGTLAGDDDCKVGTVLAVGASCSFSTTKELSGNADGPDHQNTFSASATANGKSDSASDDATVEYLPVLAEISVDKVTDRTRVLETGGDVTFTFTVSNDSAQWPATITSLNDSIFGALEGDADCAVGTKLAAGTSCSFTLTENLEGDLSAFGGAPAAADLAADHVNVFSAIGESPSGRTDTDSDDATVSFDPVIPTISVNKTASPTSVPETGGEVTFRFTVINSSDSVSARISSLTDSVFGTLAGDDDCQVGTVLAAGERCSFSITRDLAGDMSTVEDLGDAADVPTAHENTVSVAAKGPSGRTATDDDDATVTFSPVVAEINVTKVADRASVRETGANVDFTFTVKNTSDSTKATITSLTDSVFGTLAGDDDCQVGTVLGAGEACDFTITRRLEGDLSGLSTPVAADERAPSHENTLTVTAESPSKRPTTDTAKETVSFSPVYAAITVTKTADPTAVPETGGDVTFTFVVKNDSDTASAEITALTDDVFGDAETGAIAGDADCAVGTVLAAGESCTFTVTQWLAGDFGSADHVNTFAATAKSPSNRVDTDDDTARVTYTDVKPSLTVTKTAGVASAYSGDQVSFRFTVTNNSREDAIITSVADPKLVDGDFATASQACVGQTLGYGASCSFTATGTVAGELNANGIGFKPYVNVVTVTGGDDDENIVRETDDASVALQWRGRTPGFWKNKVVSGRFADTTIPSSTTLATTGYVVPALGSRCVVTPTASMLTALGFKGGTDLCGGAQILMRAAVAAELNEVVFGARYPGADSVAGLKSAVNAALASGNRDRMVALANVLDYWNNGVH